MWQHTILLDLTSVKGFATDRHLPTVQSAPYFFKFILCRFYFHYKDGLRAGIT